MADSKSKIELLAPVGSPTILKAAVESGADAVYMGSSTGWNARARARNFNPEEMAKAISYCHKNNVKAYVTLNTIIFEQELGPVAEYVKFIYEHGADAIIVQDLAVAKMARETGRDMGIFASTQMSVHNSKTAQMLIRLGFGRAILARELSLEQVKKIKENSGIETEVFCHGALCYSYSGKCLWSYYQTKRSGNRGGCAQLCRFPWKLSCGGKTVDKGYLTSTKDLNILERVQEMKESGGIDAIKIEGRLKDSRYIREVVGAYRAALDGKEYTPIKPTLRGYTTGYLFGEARKENLTNPKSQQYAGEKIGLVLRTNSQGAIVKMMGKLKVGDMIRSSSSGRCIEVFRIYVDGQEVPESEKACLLKIKTLRKGDVIFKVQRAELNEGFLERVKPEQKRKGKIFSYTSQKLDFSKAPKLFFPDGREQMKETHADSACVIPWEDADAEIFEAVKKANGKIVIDTPRVIFDEEMPAVEKRMKELKDTAEAFMVSEPSLISDHPTLISHYANVSNTLAAKEWMSFGNVRGIVSSMEIPYENAKSLGFLYFTGKNVELAISENNLFKEFGMTEEEGKGCELVDPRGNHFPIKLRDGRTIIMCPVKESKK